MQSIKGLANIVGDLGGNLMLSAYARARMAINPESRPRCPRCPKRYSGTGWGLMIVYHRHPHGPTHTVNELVNL